MDKRNRTFYLPSDLIAWIEEQAKAEHRSANQWLQLYLECERKKREERVAQPAAV